MREIEYNRAAAVSYAEKWALRRNPDYLDFNGLGGDCTNFISQCVYAGSGVMNYTPTYGWFYRTSSDRTASWTGVEFFYNFIVGNKGLGPYAREVPIEEIALGDVIQLGDENYHFYHSLLVTGLIPPPALRTIYVSTHSYDALNRRLNTYSSRYIRYLHIEGVRVE